MAMLKLTLAAGGLNLSIPSQSVRTIEGLQPGRFDDAPEASCAIRYLLGNQLRSRVLVESHGELMAMLRGDKMVAAAWLTAEMQGELQFSFQARDVAAVEDLDPDLPASMGCNLLVDLDIEGVPVVDLFCTGDGDEIRSAAWPQPIDGDVTIAAKPRSRKRAA